MKSTRRIGWLLALVFFLPAMFFSVYELSSLNRDEEMIEQVYNKQLEAILFSVNQYSDDVMNSWIAKIQNSQEGKIENDSVPLKIRELLGYNPSLRHIFISDSTGQIKAFYSSHSEADLLKERIGAAVNSNSEKVKQLISYRKSGFQKVDMLTFDWKESPTVQCLFFILLNEAEEVQVVGLLVDPEEFILDIVGPRLQVIAKDQFILSVFDKAVTAPLYSTMRRDSIAMEAAVQTKDLWLFPNHTLGIRTQESSLQTLIDKRTTTNLFLLITLNIVLVIAVVLVFRNVKREVQLAQNKADFVSNVSHEIRTPLALISMFAETLEMGRVPSEEKKKEYYSIISKESHRLTGIVNKILNFSQTEANQKKLNAVRLNANEEIQEILKTYDFHLRNHGFEYAFPANEELTIVADPEAFNEVIINLIDNAVKYSAAKKRITISTGTENNFGTVAVKDEGVGISPADQKHIFDKFYRVSSGNLAKSRGTGLGLSLVKQLMEAMGGKVSVKSELGNGSTFVLYFPLDQSNA